MIVAITRPVPASFARCELTHLERVPIDVALASKQHERYEAALESLGCEVRRLSEEPDLPDSVFVEDAAVVFDEVAIITRPGASSRRPETASVASALTPYRPLRVIEAPGTLDGGDVLRVGRAVFVGRSARTNADGVRQLRDLLAPFGYTTACADVRGCLHLKSAATAVDDDLLLVNPAWVDARTFGGVSRLDVDPDEPSAANVVRVGDSLLCVASAPRTRERLTTRGFDVRTVDVSELAKAEGGLTCCSLLFET